MGLKKALHNTLVKTENNKTQTANLDILVFPCDKAFHPQSMIVRNTRMLLFQ